MEVAFLKKLPQLVALWISHCTYLSYVKSLNHNILSYENIIYITKKTPNLVAKILATKFGFVPDCSLIKVL